MGRTNVVAAVLLTRRTVLAGLAASALPGIATAQAQEVRWSSGSEKPRFVPPAGATDCHFHTYDKTFPVAKGATLLPDDALPDDYRALQRRIGTTRGVIIQPSTYGTDNRLQIASRQALGAENFRVIAVVAEDISVAELRRLDEQGVRGVRFNLGFPGVLTVNSLPTLAPRLADLGWHCQINMRPKQIEDNADLLASLPGRLVFDHLAQVPQPAGLESAPYNIIRGLLDRGRTWVKLSGPYVSSKQGEPDYADAGAVAAAYVKAAPERMVWGSDWPHPSEPKEHKPDDARLFDLFAQCAGDDVAFKRILVDNPAELYGFPKVAP
jgi:D-galactarolactone isomerase